MIEKVNEGVIFKEDFKENNLLWTITPFNTDRFEYSNKGLTLFHGDSKIMATLQIPQGYMEYCATFEIEHIPVNENDIAGIAILSSDDENLECQSYYNKDDSFIAKYIRFVYKNNFFTFYASNDLLNWIEIGNAAMNDANRIGLFLNGCQEESATDFIIKDLTITSSAFVNIKNINPNINDVIIKEGNDIINIPWKISNNTLILDLTQVKTNIKCDIVCKDEDTEYLNEKGIILNGGDIYGIKDDISIYINNILIEANSIVSIGEITNHIEYKIIEVLNNSNYNSLKNKEIRIEEYNPYSVGHKFVQLSLYDETKNYEEHNFKDSVLIENIMPCEKVSVVMKIFKNNNLPITSTGDYRFSITIT